jgi:hypothetical protein
MVTIATLNLLPRLDGELERRWTSHSIVVSLDTSGASYSLILNGTQDGSVSYLPFGRASVSPADFPAWASSEGIRAARGFATHRNSARPFWIRGPARA